MGQVGREGPGRRADRDRRRVRVGGWPGDDGRREVESATGRSGSARATRSEAGAAGGQRDQVGARRQSEDRAAHLRRGGRFRERLRPDGGEEPEDRLPVVARGPLWRLPSAARKVIEKAIETPRCTPAVTPPA